MNLIGTKVITLDRIYLRQFNMNDVDDLFEYASNKDITKKKRVYYFKINLVNMITTHLDGQSFLKKTTN